jgi:hypothetical protein
MVLNSTYLKYILEVLYSLKFLTRESLLSTFHRIPKSFTSCQVTQTGQTHHHRLKHVESQPASYVFFPNREETVSCLKEEFEQYFPHQFNNYYG